MEAIKQFKEADAYWLSPKGVIYPVSMTHINFIRDNLELFKMTLDDYKATYAKFNEKMGWEGKARREIISEVIKNGWIRLRNRDNLGWVCELWELNQQTQNHLQEWVSYLRNTNFVSDIGLSTEIEIHQLSKLKDGQLTEEATIKMKLEDFNKNIK
ncbi:MAG: hypothetical protein NT007_00385 [Candidatus Kapabacteria bacterium]|nr:hypothetical protein [Candidatus Kapabacteria bacterium]